MSIKEVFDIGSAAFALLAAIFWGLSATGDIPPIGTYWSETPPNDPFFISIKRGAQLNRCAAIFAALAALCSVGTILFQ